MITIQYGPWTPDTANVPFQMPDQQGPVQVSVADCLNVYYANGAYQSLPSPVVVSGGTLPGRCQAALTFIDGTASPIPIAADSGGAYYWTGSAWSTFLNLSGNPTVGWTFVQFGSQVFASPALSILTPGLTVASLYVNTPGSTATSVANVPWSNVMGVVGQFVMIGDLYSALAGGSIGTGNGSQVTFTATLTPVPLYPGSVFVQDTTSGVTALDNGKGVLSGPGIASGTVNYDTGAVSVTFSVAPASGHNIQGQSSQAFRARLQWSPIGNANPSGGWPTPLTNAALAAQSGIQDLEYHYGQIMFIAGYPLYGVVFQKNAITRASYIGGNVVFSWQTYARNQGLLARGAATQVGGNVYFLSDAGFFYTDGANVYPIGTAQDNSSGMDQWFFANVNSAALGAITAGYDARKRCVFFAVPTGSNTVPDTLLTYNTIAGRWTRAAVPTAFIWTDTDGSTDQLGIFNQSNAYSLLTGAPSATGYLESSDLFFTDGNTRFTPSTRPNIACTDTPTAIIGVRNTLESSVTYSAAGAADSFGGGFAPTLNQKGIYTRVRISSTAATAINGATMKMRPGGPL